MKFQIKSIAGSVLFEGDFSSLAECVTAAVGQRINLHGSDLSYSDLSYSYLRGSNLSGSNLRGSDLHGSDLRGSNLSGSNLSYSNLSGSDLRGSNLRGSNLRGSDLRGSNLSGSMHAFAQVAFLGHGECGRTLTAYRLQPESEIVLQCGCFSGSVEDLRSYIAIGDKRLAKTRTLALDAVLVLLEARNEEVES